MQDARLAALHVLSELDPGINLSKESMGIVGYVGPLTGMAVSASFNDVFASRKKSRCFSMH